MAKFEAKESVEKIAVAFQGGGSLGAYHIGAYQALKESYEDSVHIVSGISIGAFTAAIVAGNPPHARLEQLKGFWEAISWPDIASPLAEFNIPQEYLLPSLELPNMFHYWHNLLSSGQAFIMGQPNFFKPRFPIPQLQPMGAKAALSYYDTDPVLETLNKFVDFKYLNSPNAPHLLLGATRVKDSQLVFFSNKDVDLKNSRHKCIPVTIKPRHILASGSMPPGFPPTVINGDMYWDGGCVSNTPLRSIFDIFESKAEEGNDMLAFMIDLFNPKGLEPRNMDDVAKRSKCIQYASRMGPQIEDTKEIHKYKEAIQVMQQAPTIIQKLYDNIPKEKLKDGVEENFEAFNDVLDTYLNNFVSNLFDIEALDSPWDGDTIPTKGKFNVVPVVYEAHADEVSTYDCEFSKSSIESRKNQGHIDMTEAITKYERQKSKRMEKAEDDAMKLMDSAILYKLMQSELEEDLTTER